MKTTTTSASPATAAFFFNTHTSTPKKYRILKNPQLVQYNWALKLSILKDWTHAIPNGKKLFDCFVYHHSNLKIQYQLPQVPKKCNCFENTTFKIKRNWLKNMSKRRNSEKTVLPCLWAERQRLGLWRLSVKVWPGQRATFKGVMAVNVPATPETNFWISFIFSFQLFQR